MVSTSVIVPAFKALISGIAKSSVRIAFANIGLLLRTVRPRGAYHSSKHKGGVMRAKVAHSWLFALNGGQTAPDRKLASAWERCPSSLLPASHHAPNSLTSHHRA